MGTEFDKACEGVYAELFNKANDAGVFRDFDPQPPAEDWHTGTVKLSGGVDVKIEKQSGTVYVRDHPKGEFELAARATQDGFAWMRTGMVLGEDEPSVITPAQVADRLV